MSVNAQYMRDLLVDEFCFDPISPLLLRRIENRAYQLLEKWKVEGSIKALPYVVVCDESNNPVGSIKNGFLNIDVHPADWWIEQDWERLRTLANGDSDERQTTGTTHTG